ncbi:MULTISPECIES: FecCD family ABC transporter permease [Clostridium]|uniref:ABC transporter n=2 Tax=Clostridium TaxID=1485 RepID=A0A0D1BYY5_CLOBO|nr:MULTISPECIES: iron ABC transporter permease [Clostridium]MBE6078058.1 iron ABC transporter permease [Clostridium lundense]MDU2831685.1 iron ABC transporter permease [Clostridium botulinum]KIS25292.1 ABC transporter [Clostridium botulinum B2 450]MCW7997339.1 iron ABC transporter permease [Clostridium sp. cpc1]MDU4547222.1 iron ABC transporter permease [Clostridium botulinum]
MLQTGKVGVVEYNTGNYGCTSKKRSLFTAIIIGLVTILILSIIISVSIGQVSIPFSQSYRILIYKLTGLQTGNLDQFMNGMFEEIIWQIRFPRVLLAMIAGIGLTLCGVVMQASVQNPLADPYILGISSGASLGATFSIMIGFGVAGTLSELGVAFWAFIGAFGAGALVMGLASIGGKMSSVKLVLAGTVINALCNAISSFIVYFAKDAEGIRSVTFWTMGSLTSAQWGKLPIITTIVMLAVVLFLSQARVMNTMMMGEETAVTLGINLNFYRKLYMVISVAVTGVIVATCGIIGFVGLIVPHIVRSIVGSDNKKLLPTSILFSAIFLIWADIFARTIIPNGELPIGIITSLLGAPVFMYMLVKRSYGFGGK